MKREREVPSSGKTSLSEVVRKKHKHDDTYYFESYSHLDIHEEMIRDESRTQAYRRAMLQNPTDFKDAIVLDVGCGTGILSIFAVRAGAKHVYAVDACDVLTASRELVAHNNLESKITFIQGKIEEISLPVDKVDVIISEWMGYFLLYESMLPSVLYARDKWLSPGGKMYPSTATIWMSPFTFESLYEERVNFWGHMYGIDFTPLQKHAKKTVFTEPQVVSLPSEGELSFPTKVLVIDLATYPAKQESPLSLTLETKSLGDGNLNGVMGYFSVDFVGSDATVVLSTAPTANPTHWFQTLFFLEDPVPVAMDTPIKATFLVSPMEKNPRFLTVDMNCTVGERTVEKAYELK